MNNYRNIYGNTGHIKKKKNCYNHHVFVRKPIFNNSHNQCLSKNKSDQLNNSLVETNYLCP